MKKRSMIEKLENRFLLTTFNPTTAAALTTALNSAQLGDTIILNAGTTYVGQFTLPNKTTGSGWITIQSSALDKLPGEGVRVTPQDAVNMPRIQSQGSNASAIRTPPGQPAHHYKFVGIEIVGPANNTNLTALMELGTSDVSQSTYSTVPHDLIIDRCYFRPNIPTAHIRRAIALNSAYTDIINSYIEEIHEAGSDSQAIAGWNGPGPFNIINNRLEGASENIMFGGDTTRLTGYVASDILIKNNHIIKPLHWRNFGYNVKNLFELKHGARVTLEGNILENNWTQGQTGVAIVLKLGNWGTSQWNVTEDVIIRKNIIRNTNGAIALQGRDYAEGSPEGLVRRISFTDNLFDNVNGYWGTSKSGGGNFNIYLTHGPKDVTIDHNTFLNGYTAIEVDTNSATYENDNFRFTNNIIDHNEYGIRSPDGTGNATITAYLSDGPNHAIAKNVLVNVPYHYRNNYTSRPNNYLLYQSGDPNLWGNVGFVDMANHNYRLAPASPYNNAGTDLKDIGADIDALEAAVRGVANLAFPGYSAGTLDNFTVRRLGPAGSRIEVINSAWPKKPAPTPEIPDPVYPFIDGDKLVDNFDYYQSLNFNTLDADDSVSLDYTAGSPIPTTSYPNGMVSRGLFFDGGTGADTLAITGNTAATFTPHASINGRGTVVAGGNMQLFGAESINGTGLSNFTLVTPNANDAVTIDSPEAGKFRASGTSGGVGFIPATLAGSIPLTIDTAANDAGAGNDSITVAAGANPMQSLSVNAGTGTNSLTANGGDFSLNTNLGVRGVNLDVNVNNAGTRVSLPGNQRLKSLTLSGGGDAALPVNGSGLLRLAGLSISGAGSQLDVTDNDLIIDYTSSSPLGNGSTYTGITGYVQSGRNGGAWNGDGIITSRSDAQTGLTTVGTDEAARALTLNPGQTAEWAGETVDDTTVLVKYSYGGDADLDGDLDGDDYFAIDSYIAQNGSVFGYGFGDFDYDTDIDGDDYFILDSNISAAQQAGVL